MVNSPIPVLPTLPLKLVQRCFAFPACQSFVETWESFSENISQLISSTYIWCVQLATIQLFLYKMFLNLHMLDSIMMDWVVSYVDGSFIVTIQYNRFLKFDLEMPKYDFNPKRFTNTLCLSSKFCFCTWMGYYWSSLTSPSDKITS